MGRRKGSTGEREHVDSRVGGGQVRALETKLKEAQSGRGEKVGRS